MNSVSLLEQLRNLSALAKKVSTDLATHQKRHGIRYESGMPDPNNAILAASKEIQRQVAQVVKPYSRSEAAENESWGQNPRDSFGEQTSLSGPRPSPSGSGGSAADGTPRRRVNRVPLKTSTRSKGSGSHLGDHGVGASQKGVVAQPANSRGPQSPHAGFLSLPADSARNQSKWVPSRTSPEESKRTKSNEKAHDDRSTETHPIRSKPSVEHLAFEISECSLCNCSSDHCPFSEQAESAEDKALDSNVTRGLGLPSESRKASGSEEGSSHESRRSSHEEEGEGEGEEQARHSPPTTIESEEQSAPSDKGIDSVIIVGRWSRTDLGGPPSSKSSSSPSTDSPRTPDDAKNRNSTTVRPAEFNGPREEETPDSGKEVLGVDEKKRPQPRPRTEQEQEQSVHLESAHEIRQLEARDKGTKEERRRGSESAPRESHISDDGDASSGHERPSPYVPVAPFGGPGGRRRSRRPQSKTAW
ncbi:hypothetical protein F5B21DRAFT_486333 [Xylaria acuta]|nr:hypothetical protein F5B21DRAFT_486333 [Xylaria acuta]